MQMQRQALYQASFEITKPIQSQHVHATNYKDNSDIRIKLYTKKQYHK